MVGAPHPLFADHGMVSMWSVWRVVQFGGMHGRVRRRVAHEGATKDELGGRREGFGAFGLEDTQIGRLLHMVLWS